MHRLWILLVLLLPAAGCSKSADSVFHAKITFFTGDVKIFRGAASFDASVRDELMENDLVKTGRNSQLVFQISDRDVVSVSANSELQLKRTANVSQIMFSLRKGEVISKVTKLSKGERYSVQTPLLTAAVRGTAFSVTANEGGEKISVISGKVLIDGGSTRNQRTIRELEVADGQTAVIMPQSGDKAPVVCIQEISAGECDTVGLIGGAEILPDCMNMTNDELERIRLYFTKGAGGSGAAVPAKGASAAVAEKEDAEPKAVEKTERTDNAHVIAMAKSEEAVTMKTFIREGVTLLYPHDSDILSAKSKALIDRKFGQVANQLNKDVKLLIEGYSEIGTPMTRRYNTQLSRNRAYLVSEYLIEKYGFKNTNLAIKGFGPDNPISTDRSEDGQRLNRRVEIYLVK